MKKLILLLSIFAIPLFLNGCRSNTFLVDPMTDGYGYSGEEIVETQDLASENEEEIVETPAVEEVIEVITEEDTEEIVEIEEVTEEVEIEEVETEEDEAINNQESN